jgi:hypothetical protein
LWIDQCLIYLNMFQNTTCLVVSMSSLYMEGNGARQALARHSKLGQLHGDIWPQKI